MSTLVIGAHGSGGVENIGDIVVAILMEANDLSDDSFGGVYFPSKSQLDVTWLDKVETYLRTYGPFDEIVYSAGLNWLRWAHQLPPLDFVRILEVNTVGIVNVLGAHKRLFPDDPFSAVVVTSDAAHNPMRGSTAYCSSKAAADMVVRCLAREFGRPWRVNGVAPAMVADTPMTNYIDATVPKFRGWTPEYAAKYEAQQLQGRGRISKAEVAHGILNVLRGPDYMTGAILDLSGGK